jgi:CheY-like chemotaxis protein
MTDSPARKRLLFVEASDLVQQAHVPRISTVFNCIVEQASNLTEALAALESTPPLDLILLGDLTKPSQLTSDGPEAELTIIKTARNMYPDIPILIFTSQNYIDLAYANGCTSHMIKPAGSQEIIDFINSFVVNANKGSQTA